MADAQLYSEIMALPDSLKNQVSHFVASLKQKSNTKVEKKERLFGCAKGFIEMAPDFDGSVYM